MCSEQQEAFVGVGSQLANSQLIIKYQSIHLDKLHPLCHRPHPVLLYVAW